MIFYNFPIDFNSKFNKFFLNLVFLTKKFDLNQILLLIHLNKFILLNLF